MRQQKKKILIVAPYGFNDRMGSFIEFVTARLLARHGWRVTALVKSDCRISSIDTTNGISVFRYVSLLQGIFFVLRILFFDRPSIIHVHNLRNNRIGIISAIIAKCLSKKLLFTEYGLLHDHYLTDDRDDPLHNPIHTENVVASLSRLMKAWWIRRDKKFKYFFSSYIFHWALMHADSAAFVSHHNLFIAKSLGVKNPVYISHILDDARWRAQGVDLDEQAKNHHDTINTQLDTLPNNKNVLFIGQMKLRKGWDVLLRAIPLVPRSAIEKFFIVSASGNKPSAAFQKIADELVLNGRVLFLGQIFDSELLKKIYEKSALVAIPSRYEGFGLVSVEAFAMKKPVVASDVAALNDFLVNGHNSILVPFEDHEALARAITSVATNNALARTLVAGGDKTLTEMKSEAYQNKWLSYYESFL